MTKFRSIFRNRDGAAAIEFAFALPVLIVMIYGIFQVGIAFQASAGMQHALGEGARLATVCQNPTADGVCSVATDEEIEARVAEKLFGTGIGEFAVAITRPADDPATEDIDESDVDFMDLSTTFTMPTSFLLFPGPTINLARSKRVYVAG